STRVPPVTPAPTTTTITEAQLQALIDQGVAAAMAEAEASKALRELSDSLDGLRKWSLCLALAIAQQLVKSNSRLALCKTMLLHGGMPMLRPHAMTWAALKKMMTDKYYPRGEIKKIETEMWNLKVKGTDVVAYSRRFQQLDLMCSRMFPEEIDKIEKYIGGLPDMILS
ncbi:reverse transcriptase domain-containing protein, partial [Tanacetum coccineum]